MISGFSPDYRVAVSILLLLRLRFIELERSRDFCIWPAIPRYFGFVFYQLSCRFFFESSLLALPGFGILANTSFSCFERRFLSAPCRYLERMASFPTPPATSDAV